jgi:uncharacterized membrane protein
MMFGWEMIRRLLKIFDVGRIYGRIRLSVRSNWVFYVIVSGYIIILSTVTILKHDAFLTSGFDLGLVNQAFHTTLFDGKLFYETADLSFNPSGSFFGVHFSPILFLLLPFYAIFPSVENVLVMQTVILALGAFPIYWMSRDLLGKKVGLVISIVYLVYPPLLLLNWNDFHLESFTSTFLIFSIYYLEREEWKKFSVFTILMMLTIEFAPIIGGFIALYGLLLLSKKKFKNRVAARKYIAFTAILSILMFVLAFETKAAFNTSTSPLPSPFHSILSNPAGIINVIFDADEWKWKMLYLINFLAPLVFLPLLAPELLVMALPWIFASFSTTYSPYYSVYFQYTGFVIPFMLLALPKAIERLKLQHVRRILYLIFLSTLIFSLYLPVGPGSPWNYELPTTTDRTALIQEILPLIPSNASLLTQNDIFPHVSNRINAYMYLPNSSNITPDYILVDINSQWYDWTQPEQFGNRTPPSGPVQEGLENGDYGVFASANGILLLKKGYTGEPALFVPFDSKYNYETLVIVNGSGTIIEDPTSTSGLVFSHDGEKDKPGRFWYGPYVNLLPGLYKVTYSMKVNSNPEVADILTVDVSAEAGTIPPLAEAIVNGSNVFSAGQWFNFTLFFGVRTPIRGVECRGEVWGNNSVCLDYVRIEQLVPQPISESVFYSEDLSVEQGVIFDAVMTHLRGGIMTHVKGHGIFWHGPYTSLPKGDYVAKFWLKLDKAYNGTLLDVDVATNSGKDVLEFLTLSGSNFETIDKWQSFEVKFTLQNDTNDVEFRGVNVREKAPISLRSIEVYPDTGQPQQPIPERVFYSENLVVDQGIAVKNGIFWHGPYTSLPKGHYIAKYWLKLDKAYNGTLLDLDVATNLGNKVLASLTLHSSNFEAIDKWQSFEVKFTLQNYVNIVEFRGVNVREAAPISLLAVEVYNDTGQPLQPIPKTIFSYGDLVIDQGMVANGVMIHVKGNGTFWHGPYTSLPKGHYIAKYWLKLDKAYSGVLLDVDVATNSGKNATFLTLSGSNFETIDKWQSFEVKFTLQNDLNIVEFRGVNVRDTAPISLRSIEVYPDTGG